jgi:hypothetical protein
MEANQTHDLHLRIIGSRLMQADVNPYTYYWHKGDSYLWYDPNQSIYSSVNGVTSTPFFLWLQQPLSSLSYCNIRLIWWCIEELLLLCTILLSIQLVQTFTRQLLLLGVIAAFFLFSRNWWLHVLNGQMYVLYAFAFAVTVWMSIHKKKHINTWLLPLLMLIRPMLLFTWLSNISFQKKKLALLLIGLMVSGVMFITSGTLKFWKQYNAAIKVYATEAVGGYDDTLRNAEARNGQFTTEMCLIRDKKPDFLHAGCLYSVQSYLTKLFGLQTSNTKVFAAMLVVVALLLFIVTKRLNPSMQVEQGLALGILLYFVAELMAPASRNPYVLVQWVPVVALLFAKGNKPIVILCIIGLWLNHSWLLSFKYEKEIGEIFLLLATMWFIVQPQKRHTQVYINTNDSR